MLVRWVTEQDKPQWIVLAQNVAAFFGHPAMAKDPEFHRYMQNKIEKFEALAAVDRMSDTCMGVIGFSRKNNSISWLGVLEEYRKKGIGFKLLSTALRHLDISKEISVITFCDDYGQGLPARRLYDRAGFVDSGHLLTDALGNPRCKMVRTPHFENRGGSFHYQYPQYHRASQKAFCDCCNGVEAPEHIVDVAELNYAYGCAERLAQGRLFGKCHVLLKEHFTNFEEVPEDIMAGFMKDVQTVGAALKKVSGAIKINYEIHSNSAPHLHCHLFPRYLDDDFPSSPIDYRITTPSPYENDEEFNWFVREMKKELEEAAVNNDIT